MLAAGAGERLRPLTRLRPKVLCPVGNVALVELALARFAGVTDDVAVNVHAGRDLVEAHIAGRVHLSVEEARPLCTAGALGRLRPWIGGRPTLVVNGDAWCPGGLADLVAGWDGRRARLLIPGGGPFGPGSPVAGALMPWAMVRGLEAEPAGLYEAVWRVAGDADLLEVVGHDGPFIDCGTPARYLAANLAASGGESVIGPGAVVAGEVVRSVVWAGAEVVAGERLVDAVRAGRLTVLVR
ncbi:nucleotidyltransferase family protein [soil metagenome]